MSQNYTLPDSKKVQLVDANNKHFKEVFFQPPVYTHEGKRKNHRVLIGKLEIATNTFIPNDHFSVFFDENNNPYEMDFDIYKTEMIAYNAKLAAQKAKNPGVSRVISSDRVKVMKLVIKKTRLLNAKLNAGKNTNDKNIIVAEELAKEASSTGKEYINSLANCFYTAIYDIANMYGITEILLKVFTETQTKTILNWVAFILSSNNYSAAYNFNNFAKRMNLQDDYFISSQRWSDFFKEITSDKTANFIDLWCQRLNESESVFIDYPNFTTFSNKLILSEDSKSNSREKLKQINLVIAKGNKWDLPLLYEFYVGNTSDSTYFLRSLDLTSKYFPSVKTVVLDQDTQSLDNIKYLLSKNISVATILKKSAKEYKQLINRVKDTPKEKMEIILPKGTFYHTDNLDYEGNIFQAFTYFSYEKYALECTSIMKKFEMEAKALEKANNQKAVKPSNQALNNLESQSQTKIEYTVDTDKLKRQLSEAGMYVVITNDPHLDADTANKLYSSKAVIEN
ncbi:transposase [Psittacicella hinzii]|uniref:Transposase IS4-like domain-containing protein n=1 Tax=Psittacicella hinzii TaxID=2028575 RepID=A0A3A1YCI9_9GAMM|nr:transposase [Psittacicella hinzii]RIY35852.1 hypothetical protein CKF58_06460 [Psittacicella hinzii]